MEKVLSIPESGELDIEYDEEADILYISFGRPSKATDSEDVDDVIYRYKGRNLIGITVIGFRERSKQKKTRTA